MSNIFESLRDDHDTHRTLMDLVAKTKGDSDGRRELFSKLKRRLIAHAKAEERTFYGDLLDKKLTQEKTTHSIKEHEEIESKLEELEQMDFSSPHWLRKFADLREAVEHHEAEEEHEVFQLAGRQLNERQKETMADEFEEQLQEERDKRKKSN